MNRRFLLILAAAFVILVIITVIQSQPRPLAIDNIESTPTGAILGQELDLTVLDIQAIRLRDPNTENAFIISRDADGNWTAPLNEGRLNPDAASDIAKALVLAGYQQTLPLSDETDLVQYGFAPNGTFAIEVLRTDNQGHVLAVGALSPDGLRYYVLIDDRPQLYLIERGAIDYLGASLSNPPLT